MIKEYYITINEEQYRAALKEEQELINEINNTRALSDLKENIAKEVITKVINKTKDISLQEKAWKDVAKFSNEASELMDQVLTLKWKLFLLQDQKIMFYEYENDIESDRKVVKINYSYIK